MFLASILFYPQAKTTLATFGGLKGILEKLPSDLP